MRSGVAWLIVLLAALPARAADPELRPPEARSEVDLAPGDRPAKVRVFWSCYAADLGQAARAWLHARAAAPGCAAAAPLLAAESDALRSALESAAGGRVLGGPEKGEVRSVDPQPGHSELISASFCYSADDVAQITAWTRRQLAALCE
jgi:hypothetical protein